MLQLDYTRGINKMCKFFKRFKKSIIAGTIVMAQVITFMGPMPITAYAASGNGCLRRVQKSSACERL